jgi:squalene-associated FAD-dependent desaturase
MSQHTAIVGGGLAGLAAAVALAERGAPITVFESRPRLGGRASSFLDKTTGAQIDNCQHVSLGCCTNFQHFCRTIGVDSLFRRESELYFIGRDNVVNRMAASGLPAPLHFASSFWKLSYLFAGDLLRIAVGMRALARTGGHADESITFLDWLQRHRQTPTAIDRFWNPVLVSALSETLDRISVSSARKVFVDAFLANRQGATVQIPTVPLDDLYGEHLIDWLAAHGASVRLQAGVERVEIDNGRATGLTLRTGEHVAADQVILAVPQWLALDLLPEPCRSHPDLAKIAALESAPISSVHLWFDRPILFPQSQSRHANDETLCEPAELPHAVLIDRLSQWVFNRSALQRSSQLAPEGMGHASHTSKESFSYQVVISASRDVVSMAQQDVIATVINDLAEVFPRSAGAALVHARLVTEHRAVFSVRPGVDELRPPQQSPIVNLQLAGDWTRTGWPATMEGAVRSGYLAAENVLSRLDRPARVIQPDLPVAWLSKLLLGIDRSVSSDQRLMRRQH